MIVEQRLIWTIDRRTVEPVKAFQIAPAAVKLSDGIDNEFNYIVTKLVETGKRWRCDQFKRTVTTIFGRGIRQKGTDFQRRFDMSDIRCLSISVITVRFLRHT